MSSAGHSVNHTISCNHEFHCCCKNEHLSLLLISIFLPFKTVLKTPEYRLTSFGFPSWRTYKHMFTEKKLIKRSKNERHFEFLPCRNTKKLPLSGWNRIWVQLKTFILLMLKRYIKSLHPIHPTESDWRIGIFWESPW